MIFSSQDQLDAALAKWQKILRLQDWEIRASIVNAGDNGGNRGTCTVHFQLGAATIRISSHDSGDSSKEWDHERKDMELTLVHELLHIPFHSFRPKEDSLKHELWEQAIEKTAWNLVALERRPTIHADLLDSIYPPPSSP